jgi:hypothetical protein
MFHSRAILIFLLSVSLAQSAPILDLSSQILQMGAGIYDSRSTHKERAPNRRRRVIFANGLPAAHASYAEIYFDGEARGVAWRILLTTTNPLSDYLGGAACPKVGVWKGATLCKVTSGNLVGALVLWQAGQGASKGKNMLDFYSSIYASNFEPELSKLAH